MSKSPSEFFADWYITAAAAAQFVVRFFVMRNIFILGILLIAGTTAAQGQERPAAARSGSTGQSADKQPATGGTPQERAKALNLQAIQMQADGKLREAAEVYRKAIQIYPDGPASHNNLAVVLKDLNQINEAEREAMIALKLRPGRGDYLFNLGLIQQRLGKNSEAETSFREAIKQDSMNAENHFRLSQTLLALNKPSEAEDEVKLCTLVKPNESRYHKLLADCLLQQKKNDAALCEYRTALDLNPQTVDAGDIKNKLEYLKQVLRLP